MDEYLDVNRKMWDDLTPIHERSSSYDLEGFKAGKSSLKLIEVEELGPVAGKTVLHLQCRFGLDTLSWSRLGARVTGVGFSPRAIGLAQSLAQELGLAAQFVCYNVDHLPENLSAEFDIVFTSYGALCWLPDIQHWAQVVAHCLRAGGTFYVIDHHPFADVFDEAKATHTLALTYPYFGSPEPTRFEGEGTCADPDSPYPWVSYEWTHSLGQIISALTSAGLRLEFLHEFPFCEYARFPCMHQDGNGWWWLPEGMPAIPFLFSLKAIKD
jgi:SAM-dependent methyltransferase